MNLLVLYDVDMSGGFAIGAITSCLDVVEGCCQLEPTCAKELSNRHKSNDDLEAEVNAHVSRGGCEDMFKCCPCLKDLLKIFSPDVPICTPSYYLLM